MSDQIPQEIVGKALRIYDIHRTDSGQFGPASSSRESMRVALEAVLPDLQQPLLDELESRPPKWVNEQLRQLNRDFINDCEQMKRERDARPDLTSREREAVLVVLDSITTSRYIDSARAKLEALR